MKIYYILFFLLVNISLQAQTNKENLTFIKKSSIIDFLKEEPTWAKNCQHIYIGDYMKSVVDENYRGQLIAIAANLYEKPTTKVTNFTDFIAVSIDGVKKILKFYKIEKQIGKIEHNKWIYKDDVNEVILDYYTSNTRSGVGDGGDFIFKKNNLIIYKAAFYKL